MALAKAIIIGNLGRDPELKYLPSGDAVCNFSVAVSTKRKDQPDDVLWVKAKVFGKSAENAQKFLAKGSQVYLEGRLQLEKYNDRNDVPQTVLVLNVTEMQFIGSKPQTDAEAPRAQAATAGSDAYDPEKEIPF